MKIKDFKLYKVPPRWLFLKIETDEGISGWGEPIIEGKADSVEAAVIELMSMIKNSNPLHIQDIWNMIYRGGFYRGGPILMSALSGIDQALWDIKGKYHQVPVHELLGGPCRKKIEIYSWVGGDEPKIIFEEVQKVIDKGFKTIKINGTGRLRYIDSYKEIDLLLERMAILREKFGMEINIGIDFHGRVRLPMAKILMKKLEEFNPIFIEEPLLSENISGLEKISKLSNIPIALGERIYSRWGFKTIFEHRIADIIQPDLSHAGGITECYRIAAMAESYDVALAPHCPLGPIALASCLQLDAVAYNAAIQEQSLGIHYNKKNELLDYVHNSEIFLNKNGFIDIPSGPGLGVDINEDYVEEMSKKSHEWHNPLWRHVDGTVAEW